MSRVGYGDLLGVPTGRWGKGGGISIEWLLLDQFTTDASAPITSPRTAEPGPGTLTLTDTSNHVSIVSARLRYANSATAWTNPRAVYDGFARATGRALMFTVNNAVQYMSGWWATTTGGSSNSRLTLYSPTVGSLWASTGTAVELSNTATTGTNYHCAAVLRTAGGFLLVKGGTQYTDWTLLWVDHLRTDATLYPCLTNNGEGQVLYDNVGVSDLEGPWLDNYGIATDRIASASAGSTINHEANTLIDATWTAVTGQTWELDLRRTDDDNRWIVRCDQAGGTIKLIERNAGTETERSSAAQSFSNGAAYRLVVIASGSSIKTFTGFAVFTPALKNSYASASFNATATTSKTDKAVTDYIAWPRTLTGEAAQWLDAANFL